VTLIGSGRSGWIDGVHYLAVYIEFLGVFTPEGGGEPMANPGATVFDAMLLHDGVSRNWLARSVIYPPQRSRHLVQHHRQRERTSRHAWSTPHNR
jgi:hypothetical protein